MSKTTKHAKVNHITTWKGVRLVRDQAFLPIITSIAEFSKTHSFVKIGIVGQSASGKSTLAQAITHALHVYYMKKYGEKFSAECFYYPWMGDGYNFSILKPNSCIVTVDDFNCIEEVFKNKMEKFESIIRAIRRSNPSMRVVFICTYFDTDDLDEYHLQENFRFFIDRDYGGLEQLQRFCGRELEESTLFTEMHLTAVRKGKWRTKMKNGMVFYYKYRKPFVPCLFWNGQELKNVVTPRRQFMDEECNICKHWEKMWWRSE